MAALSLKNLFVLERIFAALPLLAAIFFTDIKVNRKPHDFALLTHRKVKDDLGICHLDVFYRIRKDP